MNARVQVRHIARAVEERKGDRDLPLLSVSAYRGVVRRSEITADEPRADDLTNYRFCAADDIVINRMSAYQGALGKAKEDGVVSPDYLVLRLQDRASPAFIEYLFRSHAFVAEMASRVRGIGSASLGTVRTPRINWTDLGAIEVELPSVGEQRQIAEYLDRATGKIDELIAKQEQLVETLAERRRAVIASAVTGGLSPQVPFCSTAEWFGRHPAHWKIGKIGQAFQLTLGKMLNESSASAGELRPYLRAGNIQEAGVDITEVKLMAFSPNEIEALTLKRGDVVVVEGGGGYGRSDYLESDLEGWGFQNHVIRARPRSGHDGQYFDYLVKTIRASGTFESLGSFATIPNVSADKLARIRYAMPPLEEQKAIAAHIGGKVREISRLTEKVGGALVLLRERRAALISAAVTGKIDVRGS